MTTRRIGLWLIGAWGGVSATAVLGIAALKRKLMDRTSLVSANPVFAHLDLDDFDTLVVGGHEIRDSSFADAVRQLHEHAGVFDSGLMQSCMPDLDDWNANVRPGTVLGAGDTIGKLVELDAVREIKTPRQAIDRIQADLKEFQKNHHLDQVIVANATSTEPLATLTPAHQSMAEFTKLLAKPDAVVPASSLYGWAALDLGFPYVNFTPSLGSSFPAAQELAVLRKTCMAGQDGKTGETLMKSALAPMFKHRNFQILSWVGHNIFGNRDGLVLDDPVNKESKIRTKDQVVSSIVGYKPNTLVTIEYIPSMDDWKTAWNHIHFKGFLNTKMVLQFIWQGCDSLLAAPLLLDMVRFTLLSQRRGETGVLKHLASFFKNPMGVQEHDFFVQYADLEAYARGIPGA